MLIHLYQQFYSGSAAPGPAQPRKLTQTLAERGHQVCVLTCDFNAYSEQTEPEEQLDFPGGGAVRVLRLRAPRKIRSGLKARLNSYGTFAWRAWRRGLQLPRPDVVLGSIQPLFTGVAALSVARRRHVPMVVEVRDLWPDALVVKGAIKPWQARPLYYLERRVYAGATRIVSLTPGIKVELLKKGIAPQLIDVLPNAFNPDLFRWPTGTRERIRAELGWDGQFVALFAGVHTEVTAVETIVRAASVLKNRADIRFELFGNGQAKPAAVRLAQELGLTNIHFHDAVPKTRVLDLLAGVDAGLMTLFKSPLIHIYFENKLIDYMGAGLPILGAMDGMQGDIIRRFGAGKVVGSFDHEGLAALVAEAADHPEAARALGCQGQKMIERQLLQRDVLERYARLLEAVGRAEGHTVPPWEPFVT